MASQSPFTSMRRRDVWRQALADRGGVSLIESAGSILERAYAADPAGTGSLGDIEHVVLLMQENRSFDHYFGTMSGVRGFDDSSPAFRQRGYEPGKGASPAGYLNPFRLNCTHGATLNGEVINDPTHDWGPQHQAWHDGAMDQWITTHLAAGGAENGPVVMGYYTRDDIPVHRALADAFTICDHYFCSVLGPTDPNRLYWMTGTIDPGGEAGGPVLETSLDPEDAIYSWRTYPEQLEDAGVSWKIYEHRGIVGFLDRPFLSGMMRQFKAFSGDSGSRLAKRALDPSFPDVVADPLAADLRAPGDAASRGRRRDPARARHPHLEPRGLGEDGPDRQLRRERRVLRPRPAARSPAGYPGRIHHRPARRSPGRRRHRRADRDGLPRPVPDHLPIQPRRPRRFRRL
jgi:phospholipase C